MKHADARTQWSEYCSRELAEAKVMLGTLGFSITDEQPHLSGERFLMVGSRDVGGGGYKLVLLGMRTEDRTRVVIKISSDSAGMREIETERNARETIRSIAFGYRTLRTPDELLYGMHGPYRVFITAFVPQERAFLDRTLEEQFTLALDVLKTQESVHSTTSSHARAIRSAFGPAHAKEYLEAFRGFGERAVAAFPEQEGLGAGFAEAERLLTQHKDRIEQYCDFLTHSDFVPHNIRVHDQEVYLLDAASLHFGNKHESWARFINFMTLHNRPLADALVAYLRENRTPEESESLRLMRIYKTGALLEYHARARKDATGNLRTLCEARVAFWLSVLTSLIADEAIPEDAVTEYAKTRDALRSEDEKKRQQGLH